MSAPDATQPVGAGSVLCGRYRLVRLIAHGGMAAVWEAHDNVLARAVAVKMLHPHLASDQLFLERFRREAVAAARLAHPNVVATFDAGITPQGTAFIVMELIRGRTLSVFESDHRPLPFFVCIEIGMQIADALAHAHAAGLIHRDVKPANVLVCDTESDGVPLVKVTDFGIAKAAEGLGLELTKTGMVLGTPKYLSPEQIEGREPDARADVYALGVVLFEMVAGIAPFRGPTEMAVAVQHLNDTPARLRDLRPNVPPALEILVAQMLAKRPENRPPSAAAVRRALSAIDVRGRQVRPAPTGGAVGRSSTSAYPGSGSAGLGLAGPGSVSPGARGGAGGWAGSASPGSGGGGAGSPGSGSRGGGSGGSGGSGGAGSPGSGSRGGGSGGSDVGRSGFGGAGSVGSRPGGREGAPPAARSEPPAPGSRSRSAPSGRPSGSPSAGSRPAAPSGYPVDPANGARPTTAYQGSPPPAARSDTPWSSPPRATSGPAPPRPRLSNGSTPAIGPIRGQTSPPHPVRRPNWAGRLVLALVIAAILVIIFVLAHHGPAGTRASSTGTTVGPAPVKIQGVSVFTLGGDADHASTAGYAIDGNPDTSWETDHYDGPNFGGLYHGIGLAFTLASVETLHQLKVISSTTGWSAQVYVADAIPNPPSLAPWGTPVASQQGINGSTTFNLNNSRGSAILLWITNLGPTYQASIAEVSAS